MNGCTGCVLDTCLRRSYYGPPFKSLQYKSEDRTSMSSEEQHRTMGNNWESQAGRRAQNRRPSSFSSWALGSHPSLPCCLVVRLHAVRPHWEAQKRSPAA